MADLPTTFDESVRYFEGIPGDPVQKERQEQLRRLASYVERDSRRPIFVTGSAGVGKSALVRYYIGQYRPFNTEVEWVYLDRSPDPIQAIETVTNRLRGLSTIIGFLLSLTV